MKVQINYKGVHINNAHDFEWHKTHFASNEVGASSIMSQTVPCGVFWEILGTCVHMYIFKLLHIFSCLI